METRALAILLNMANLFCIIYLTIKLGFPKGGDAAIAMLWLISAVVNLFVLGINIDSEEISLRRQVRKTELHRRLKAIRTESR